MKIQSIMISIIFLAGISAVFLSQQSTGETSNVDFILKVQDVYVGEFPMGASRLFKFIINNQGEQPVKLYSSTATPWFRFSSFWKVHLDGPVDNRCKPTRPEGLELPAPESYPHIEIKAKEKRVFDLPVEEACTPGVYQVWVEYNGNGAPGKGVYQGHIESDKVSFNVKEAQGVDAEILQLWQKQNPDKPICYFPLEMEPNILQPSTLLSHFPTSTYAVWVVLPYLGKPDKADPSKIFELVEKGTYPMWNGIPDPETKKWKGMKGKELAEYQNKWINTILSNHPDFAYALRLRLTLAINHIVLGDIKEGKKMLRDLTKETDKKINGWAQQFLNLIEKKEIPTKQKLLYLTD